MIEEKKFTAQDYIAQNLVKEGNIISMTRFVLHLMKHYNDKCATRVSVALLDQLEKSQKWPNEE